MLGVKRYKVTLSLHDDNWENEYEIAKNEIMALFSENIVEICHVGSTTIKGIVAKPILDIAVVIKNTEELNISGMETIGYEFCGEAGVPGRYLFVRRVNGDISTHHIHCYPENHENYRTTVLFCNFLNKNYEYAQQYNDLKIKLSEKYSDDRNAYTEAKADFINNIISLAQGIDATT